jgi:hypothetical protein
MSKNILLRSVLLLFLISGSFSVLANVNEFGECETECKKTFSQLKKYASHGSPKAQTLLALAYKSGEGVEVNNEYAWRWIRRAHRQAYPPALHIASKWFRTGYYTAINIKKADSFLERAIKQDYGPAILDYGILNYQRENDKLAIELITKASDMGSLHAKKILQKIQAGKKDIVTENRVSKIDNPNKSGIKTEQPSTLKDDETEDEYYDYGDVDKGEVMTVIGNQMEPILLLANIVTDIKESKNYDFKGSPGSRVSDRKCGKEAQDANIKCEVIDGVWAKMALTFFQMENGR